MNLIFKALNDETRRSILKLLKEKDMNAGEIAEHFDISKPSISHHLDILKRAELISSTRAGQHLLYSLNMTVVEDLLGWFLSFTKDEKDEIYQRSTIDPGIDQPGGIPPTQLG